MKINRFTLKIVRYFLAVFMSVFFSTTVLAQDETYSALWGIHGELWNKKGRLPDFSFAGYMEGLQEIPNNSITKNIKTDYGAIGDGVTNDTKAFLRAIHENKGVIFIPQGKYVITEILKISTSNFVFRGAGPNKTILYFPKSLMDIKPIYVTPNSRFIKGQTNWYHGKGGHIWVEGSFGQEKINKITKRAERGDKSIELDDVTDIKLGQFIEISQQDDSDKSLARYLYTGASGAVEQLNVTPWQVAKVIGIKGKTIELDRGLRFKIDFKWQPVVNTFNPSVSEVGIENLTIEYPSTNYKGHFYEENNGIYFGNITNSWIKNVTVLNADEAFLIHGRFCTLERVSVGGQRGGSLKGHNGILLDGNGGDNLVQNFTMDAVYMHAISVRNTAGNVFSTGKGNNIDLDCAAHCPYANLFTNIDLGKGTNVWKGSGGLGQGKSSASWNTFWNIRSDVSINFPESEYGSALINVIGVHSTSATVKTERGKWFERIAPIKLVPSNIYEAQLERRKSHLNK